jgi:hypothetical protein
MSSHRSKGAQAPLTLNLLSPGQKLLLIFVFADIKTAVFHPQNIWRSYMLAIFKMQPRSPVVDGIVPIDVEIGEAALLALSR